MNAKATERPILFSAPMIEAILSGTKTQTRRLWKMPPGMGWYVSGALRGEETGDICDLRGSGWCDVEEVRCLYGRVGDRLWVRETCRAEELLDGLDGVRYLADKAFRPIENTEQAASDWVQLHGYRGKRGAIVPSIHMPRWASRITLEITDWRVERLQEIREGDALAEGISSVRSQAWDREHFPAWRHNFEQAVEAGTKPPVGPQPTEVFRALWQSINGPGSWDANPWVWVIEFERVL